jgi:hypothetical protein
MIISNVRHRLAASTLVLALATAGAASGDTPNEQRAVVLFEKGRRLARDGRCAEAIAPLLESIRYAEGVGSLLNLGACYETLGKTASAHRWFVRAEELAAARADKRRDEAAQRAKSLEKELSVLVVQVPSSLRDVAQVRVDGEPLPRDRWGVAIPVDPGSHDIEVVVPPNPKQADTVNVRAKGDRVEWTVPLPKKPPYELAAPPPTTIGKAPNEVGDPSKAVGEHGPTPAPWSTQRTLGAVASGAGLVGLTLGGVFGVISVSKHASVTGRCPSYPTCSASDRGTLDTMNDAAKSAGTISTIAIVAGVLLLASGAVLYFTAPP